MSTMISDLTVTIDGVVFGIEEEATGTQWIISKITGWHEPPPSSSTMTDRVGGHGAVPGKLTYGRRTITLSGVVGTEDRRTAATLTEFLAGLIADGEHHRFVVDDIHLPQRWVYVQRGEFKLDWDGMNAIAYQMTFVAPDYRRYSVETTYKARLMTSDGGGGLDATNGLTADPVLNAGADTRNQSVTVWNNGFAETDVVMYLHAGDDLPLEGPINIYNGLTDRVLTYDGDIPAGHFIKLDGGHSKSVLYDGYESRRELLSSARWSTIPPKTGVPFSWDHAGGDSPKALLEIVVADANL